MKEKTIISTIEFILLTALLTTIFRIYNSPIIAIVITTILLASLITFCYMEIKYTFKENNGKK